jgi:hypothetical protein
LWLSAVVAAGLAAPAAAQTTVDAADLAPVWARGADGRVDVVMLGDSNQLHNGFGWDEGWNFALRQTFGLYATGLLHAGENNGVGAGVGWGYNTSSTFAGGQFLYGGAPPELDVLMNEDAWPDRYLYVPEGALATGTQNMGMILAGALDESAALRFHVTMATFPGAPGADLNARPNVRLDRPPWSIIALGDDVRTRVGAFGVVSGVVDVPAEPGRLGPFAFRYTPFDGAQPVRGPFLAYYLRAEEPGRSSGASAHTFFAFGGRSARFMAERLLAMSDAGLDLYFAKVRELQAPPRRVLVRIAQGLNDRNDTGPSLGLGLPSNTPEGYADNLRVSMDRIAGVWTRNGWPGDELFFLLAPSHPVADPDEELLVRFRAAADALALSRPRTASVRFDRLTSATEMLASGWYNLGGASRNHLSQAGFRALAARELDALRRGACPADLNADGELTFDDIQSFVLLYNAEDPRADFNADGEWTFDDIQAFVTRYNAGC